MQLTTLQFRVYDHNIRYDNQNNRDDGERLWSERKVDIVSSINFHTQYLSVVTLQEVLHNQLEDILEGLGDDWTYYGIGRDDGKTKGEYAPVLFRKSEWKLTDSWTKWLSDTPEEPSRGWDAVLPRIVTFARLKHKVSGREVGIFNTHYDHAGEEARKQSSKLIIGWMKDALESIPVSLSGDFNSSRTDIAYETLSKELLDSGTQLPEKQRYGHSNTFCGFQGKDAQYIDFIWLPPQGVKLRAFGIAHSEFHGYYMSDHRPVIADLEV
uniref:ARAD1C06226p n=1 Tax=Blastobotrys adeninivorans TaxID=409370 RepID=A0A060T5K9_BLAAD